MKAILFGEMSRWEKALDLIQQNRSDIQIAGVCDPNRQELAASNPGVYTIDDMLFVYHDKKADAIINIDASIPIWNEWFHAQGVIGNYAISTRCYSPKVKGTRIDDLLQPYGYIRPELQHLEFHLADHCNLKCKGCTHFSNLVEGEVFPEYESLERDFTRLSELFYNIKEIHLMGGEPLLNPEVARYCEMVRSTFPYAEIAIATNGLLIPTMKDELFDAIRKNDIMISISNYTCLDDQKILGILSGHGVTVCEMRNGKQTFMKNLNPKGGLDVTEVFNACPKRVCTALKDGLLAACIQPLCIKYFNERYGTELSDKGTISIYEEGIDGYRIIEHLSRPMDACRFCGFEEPYEWEISKEPIPMSDWCVGE